MVNFGNVRRLRSVILEIEKFVEDIFAIFGGSRPLIGAE